jgi:hypothetical protein
VLGSPELGTASPLLQTRSRKLGAEISEADLVEWIHAALVEVFRGLSLLGRGEEYFQFTHSHPQFFH